MNHNQTNDDDIEFPPFENFQVDSIDNQQKNTLNIIDLKNEDFDFDVFFKTVDDFINEQLSNENLIYFPQEYLNMIAFSPKSNDVYCYIKDQIINFSSKMADEIKELNSNAEIANKWHHINQVVKNVFHYFNIFTLEKESFSKIVYSSFNKQLSEHSQLIKLMHEPILDSFNSENIQWFSIDCSDLLIKCDLFDDSLIINNLNLNFQTMQQIDHLINICHSLIPSSKVHSFLDYLTAKVSDFTPFFSEVTQNWKYISALYEVYEYKKNIDDFILKFTELVKSQFTAFNPFQIFDEIHSLASTNLMFVIRNIATTLFNGQNDMFSILLANYVHITFISLKQPISDERLMLFDEFGQLSNGFFVRYHSHNLLKRLLNYQSLTFDADERFSKIINHHHITAIIDDFKNKQRAVDEFENPSQLLTISLFNHEFFAEQSNSQPKFPPQFSFIIGSFQDYCSKKFKYVKIRWSFSLMNVTFNVLNISGLKYIKCNGIIALILIKLSENSAKNKSMKSEDLAKELQISEQEINESIEALNTFSLVNIGQDHSINLATSLPDAINNQVVIPSIPKITGVPNQAMVNTTQLEAMITRYVKLHPGFSKEEIYNQISALPNFSFTEQEYYNALKILIKKQIISPLGSSQALRLTFS